MYTAIFEIEGCYKMQCLCEGDSANAIYDALEKVQDLSCIADMGRMKEKAKGLREVKKLDEIISKRYSNRLTIEDLLSMDVKLSVGSIRCIDIVKGDEAALQLKEKYPRAT